MNKLGTDKLNLFVPWRFSADSFEMVKINFRDGTLVTRREEALHRLTRPRDFRGLSAIHVPRKEPQRNYPSLTHA